ncbi:MAG: PaaI family thioesterase [Dehalococcoidia bacterium]|nr:PaaI family thioesterase [Dehalococcoidia bacterium]
MEHPPNPRTGKPMTPAALTAGGEGHLPGHMGVEITDVRPDAITARIDIQPHHIAPNGYLHAATVVTLADTACGYGALAFRADGATGFTTIEIKTNYLGTARDGAIVAEARKVHGGRMTQVWDAEVRHEETDKVIALFRCTQMMLYPQT